MLSVQDNKDKKLAFNLIRDRGKTDATEENTDGVQKSDSPESHWEGGFRVPSHDFFSSDKVCMASFPLLFRSCKRR